MNANIEKTCMCSICKKLFVDPIGNSNCCRDCEKKIVLEYKDKIIEFSKTHPGSTVMDLLNSDVIKPSGDIKISAREFKNLVLNACYVVGKPTEDINNNKKAKNSLSALTRDLEELNRNRSK